MFTLSEPKEKFRAKSLLPVSGSWRSIDLRVYQGLEGLLSLNQKKFIDKSGWYTCMDRGNLSILKLINDRCWKIDNWRLKNQ